MSSIRTVYELKVHENQRWIIVTWVAFLIKYNISSYKRELQDEPSRFRIISITINSEFSFFTKHYNIYFARLYKVSCFQFVFHFQMCFFNNF
jgi:hypothetical protein